MKLTRVIILMCWTNGAKAVTSPITGMALQMYKTNRQIAQNKLAQAGQHRQQTKGPGTSLGFAELLQKIQTAQIVVAARRRCRNRFGPKVGGCIQRGTMEQFRRMKQLAGSYVQRSLE